jgi:hypothetical protein
MNVHNTGHGEARHIRYEKDLNCAAVKITTVQVTNLPLPQTLSRVRFDLLNRSGLTEALHTYIGYTCCIYNGYWHRANS